MAKFSKKPKGTTSGEEAARDKRVSRHMAAIARAPSPLAYAMKTYNTEFFQAEEDSTFKVALAAQLDSKFPNENQLWNYIANHNPKVAHLL